MSTPNMGIVDACLNDPVRSRDHNFTPEEKADYDSLNAKGRLLYDNLRTQYDIVHSQAYAWAVELYGAKS